MKSRPLPLHDIIAEIAFLHSVRDRTTFEDFLASSADVRAAAYSVLIISEAVRRIPDAWLAEQPTIPWSAIRAIGNKLRHEYHRVSETILLDVICRHTEPLSNAVETMIRQHPDSEAL